MGITKSYEIHEHIQSYLLIIDKKLFLNSDFVDWFKKMKPINKRQNVIEKYELGLSKLILDMSFSISSLFKKNLILYEKYKFNFFGKVFCLKRKRDKKNPMHFYYKEIYNEFGIIKIELLTKNPFKIDLYNIKKIFVNKKIKELIKKQIYSDTNKIINPDNDDIFEPLLEYLKLYSKTDRHILEFYKNMFDENYKKYIKYIITNHIIYLINIILNQEHI